MYNTSRIAEARMRKFSEETALQLRKERERDGLGLTDRAEPEQEAEVQEQDLQKATMPNPRRFRNSD